ncbi:MAG TPA: endolytic transglycosylase MltG, partial [Usitatibacter sp.]|nr:endolytic transglycosylase MltG [Usitatibacter sp.]
MRLLRRLLLAVLAVALLAAAWLYWFATRPLEYAAPIEVTVRPGWGLALVANQLVDTGMLLEPYSLRILAGLTHRQRAIHAGTYRFDKPLTPLELLDKLGRGDVMLADMRFVEGTTLRQWLAQLSQEEKLRKALAPRDDAGVRALLGLTTQNAEGWLFPDTYRFAPGTPDTEVLKRAYAAMKRRLEAAWAARDPQLPLETPYQFLILASIVEKETGAAAERPLVASVFVNRLRKGMRLQTDPTVIYGIGEKYDGNIRKRDLTTDTPWNTYTRDGLPPTPIAMPGAASLQAVSRPAQSDFLYFVGKAD